MDVEFCSVSGYNEVGKNMSALRVGNEAVVFDMGFYMQKLADYEERNGDAKLLSREQLIRIEAVPDDRCVRGWASMVRGIVCSHAHLDHVGAVPYLAPQYQVPVFGTPLTLEVLRNQMYDDDVHIPNQLRSLQYGARVKLGEHMELEFIRATHSVPQTVMVAVHTRKGTVLYTNDFKFDNHPVIGRKPDFDRLRELGKEGVLAVVADSLYCGAFQKTPSEWVAREMLEDCLTSADTGRNALLVTCFASHLARIKSVIELGRKLNRKVVLLGRSVMKYAEAAHATGVVNFSEGAEIVGYAEKVREKVKLMAKRGKEKFLVVCTGGQGEPRSILAKMLRKEFHFDFRGDDAVVFSNRVIPVEPNVTNRKRMEASLERHGVRIFRDVHVSGHSSREDLRDLIKLLNPEHIIPSHGHHKLVGPMVELGAEMGFSKGQVHLMSNGQKLLLE